MVVKHKQTGQVGTIPDDKFDPNLFEKMDNHTVVPAQSVQQPQTQAPTIPQPQSQTSPESQKGWAENIFDAATAPIQHYGHLLGGFLEPTVTAATGGAVQLPKLTPEEDKRLQNPAEGLKEIGKTGLALESYAISPAKSLMGALFKGGVSGAMYGAGTAKPGEEIKGAKEGAVGGAIGGGIFHGAGQLAEGMTNAGGAIRKGIASPQVTASPFATEEENMIVDTLGKLGFKGSAEQQRQQMPKIFRSLSGEIQRKLGSSTKSMGTADVVHSLDDALENNINYDSSLPVMENAKNKFTNQLLKMANKGEDGLNIPAKAFYEYKQNLGGQLSNAFKKLDKGTPLTPQEEVGMTIWHKMDDILTSLEPGVKDLTKTQSVLYKAAPGLQKSANSKMTTSILGTSVPLPTGIIQGTADTVARGMQGAGKALSAVASPATEMAGRTIGAGMATDAIPVTPTMTQNPTDPTQTPAQQPAVSTTSGDGQFQPSADGQFKTNTQTGEVLSSDEQWKWDKASNDWVPNQDKAAQNGNIPSEDQLKSAYTEALQTGNKKMMGVIEDAYKFYYPQNAGTKKYTDTQLKELSVLQTSVNLIDNVFKYIDESKDLLGPVAGRIGGSNAYDTKAQVFQSQMNAVAQQVGRAMEGGVLRKEDEEKYKKILPQLTDPYDVAKGKLENVKNMLVQQALTKQNMYSTHDVVGTTTQPTL